MKRRKYFFGTIFPVIFHPIIESYDTFRIPCSLKVLVANNFLRKPEITRMLNMTLHKNKFEQSTDFLKFIPYGVDFECNQIFTSLVTSYNKKIIKFFLFSYAYSCYQLFKQYMLYGSETFFGLFKEFMDEVSVYDHESLELMFSDTTIKNKRLAIEYMLDIGFSPSVLPKKLKRVFSELYEKNSSHNSYKRFRNIPKI